MNLSLARTLENDTRHMKKLSSELVNLVQNQYLKGNFNDYEYSRIIDLVTVMNQKNEKMSFNLTEYRLDKQRKRKVHVPIDVRI